MPVKKSLQNQVHFIQKNSSFRSVVYSINLNMPRGEHHRSDRDRDRDYRDRRERADETGSQEILDEGIIQVQVIPQDDNWGETATSITETATSIVTLSETDLSDIVKERRRISCGSFGRHVKLIPQAVLCGSWMTNSNSSSYLKLFTCAFLNGILSLLRQPRGKQMVH